MRERNRLEAQISAVKIIETNVADAIDLIELADSEGDEDIVIEAEKSLSAMKIEAEKLQLESLLSGEADPNDAYLEINSGAGGTESQDWAEMLLRMY